MRVLLIRPNSKWEATYISIGLGYLADAVRKLGHEVSILDLNDILPNKYLIILKKSSLMWWVSLLCIKLLKLKAPLS